MKHVTNQPSVSNSAAAPSTEPSSVQQTLASLIQVAEQLGVTDRSALAHSAEVAAPEVARGSSDTFARARGRDAGAAHSVAGETTGRDPGHVRSPAGRSTGRGEG